MYKCKKVSIIMPVYGISNIKKNFIAAVKSVLRQTHTNFEFILVNDGSPDDTLRILTILSKKDDRIVVINKENGGVESSRRAGLKIATGDYVFHMDQDDLLRKDTFEILIETIEKDQSDIAIAESVRFIGIKLFSKKNSYFKESVCISHREFMDKYYIGFFGVNNFPVNIWNKLYRKSFLDSIDNPPLVGLYNEDLNYNMYVMPEAKKISLVREPTYYYRWGGFTNHKIKGLNEVALSCYQIKKDMISKYDLDNRPVPFTYYISVELLNQMFSVLKQEVEYDNISLEEFVNLFEELLLESNVRTAIDYLRVSEKKPPQKNITYFICEDAVGLYEMIISNHRRKMLKKIFLSLFEI